MQPGFWNLTFWILDFQIYPQCYRIPEDDGFQNEDEPKCSCNRTRFNFLRNKEPIKLTAVPEFAVSAGKTTKDPPTFQLDIPNNSNNKKMDRYMSIVSN